MLLQRIPARHCGRGGGECVVYCTAWPAESTSTSNCLPIVARPSEGYGMGREASDHDVLEAIGHACYSLRCRVMALLAGRCSFSFLPVILVMALYFPECPACMRAQQKVQSLLQEQLTMQQGCLMWKALEQEIARWYNVYVVYQQPVLRTRCSSC